VGGKPDGIAKGEAGEALVLRLSLCQRHRSRGIMTWYARIFDTSTKEIRYESLGTVRKTEAREEMQAKLSEGAFRKPDENDVTLGDALDSYLVNLERNGCSAGTVKTARCAFRAVQGIRGDRIRELTPKRLQDAFATVSEAWKPGTFNTARAYVRAAIESAIKERGMNVRNPADSVANRKNRPAERGFWTPEQVDRILDAAPSRKYRLLWAFMAFCGLRVHEARKAKPEDVRDGFIYVVGKGGKPAKIPICERMREEIRKAGEPWDLERTPCDSRVLVKAAEMAIPEGFPGKATNHRFRHSFASNLIRAGVNIKAVQVLMRHASIQTTLGIYSHVLEGDLKGELEKMFGNS
jgi:integrase